jgi:hypothetical protein
MPRSPRPERRSARCAATALALIALLLGGGCAAQRGTAPNAAAVFRALLGRNAGLGALRAVAEAHLAFGGREVSLPGVLQLDSLGGFRLELLDPLDRPLAILFAEEGRVVNYRPAQKLAASLGVFPAACRGVDPADWVAAVLASSAAPSPGEGLVESNLWGSGRVLERHRDGALRQSVRYASEGGQPLPRLISWYCEEEPVLQLRLLEWVQGPTWRLPSRFQIEFPKAVLTITVELREIEVNPPSGAQPFLPRLGPEIRWTSWNLPQ